MKQRLQVALKEKQHPARIDQIFILEKAGDNYWLRPTFDPTGYAPLLHGRFVFAVLASNPTRVYCGLAYDQTSSFKKDAEYMIEGHTSLTSRQDVVFAGELYFHMGRLFHWTNRSGHYRPPASLREHLYPQARLLLPEELFCEHEVFASVSNGISGEGSSKSHHSRLSSRLDDFSDDE